MEAEHEAQKRVSLRVLGRVIRFAIPYWKLGVVAFLLIAAVSAMDLAMPYIAGEAINRLEGAAGKGGDIYAIALPFAGLYLLLSILRAIGVFCRVNFRSRMDQYIHSDIRCLYFDTVQRLSASFHDKSNVGQLISCATRDVNMLNRFFSNCIFLAMVVVLYIVGAIVLIMTTNLRLGLIVACMGLLTILWIKRAAGRLGGMWKETNERYGDMTTVLQENIAGARIVRSFAKEEAEIEKFRGKSHAYLGQLLRTVYYWALRIPIAQFVFGLSIPLTLLFGYTLIIDGEIAVGDLAKCILYIMGIAARMQNVGSIVEVLVSSAAAAERFYDVVDKLPGSTSTRKGVPLPAGKGEIVFENVSFGYSGEKKVLQDIDLRIAPGEMVAFMGKPGSGKSTLIQLIPRFYEPSSGKIRIDGLDIANIDPQSLRRNVGVVFQESFLFSASVAENVGYGNPDAGREKIEEAARIARAHDFIMQLDDGYETIVGERGITLSGGQKQRVAIARVFLMNPRILIMDDATSSVDSETEQLILKAMVEIARGRTTIVISQRISTVMHANRIAVMDEGRIVDIGTHNELLAKDGVYRRIYDEQMAVGAAV